MVNWLEKDCLVVVQCEQDNHHSPPCPHLSYLKTLMERTGMDLSMDTVISDLSEKRRQEGLYQS